MYVLKINKNKKEKENKKNDLTDKFIFVVSMRSISIVTKHRPDKIHKVIYYFFFIFDSRRIAHYEHINFCCMYSK